MQVLRNKNTFYIVFFFVIGFAIYSNLFFNNFIGDDQLQIVKSPLVHSMQYIPLFFISSLRNLQTHGVFFDSYYRPVMFTSFSILYSIGKGSPFPFHVFQLIIHIVNVIFIFFLFNNIFSKKLSFFLASIFLVHPVNEETVAFIANLQDVLFPFFGLFAIFIIQRTKKITLQKKVLVCFLFLLSLFSKETGILSLAIVGIYILFFHIGQLKAYIISFFTAIFIYGIFRIIASQFYFINLIPLMKVNFSQRILYIPKVTLFYLREFFLPTMTFAFTSFPVKTIHFSDILMPLGWVMGFFLLIGITGYIVWRHDRRSFRYFLFFLFWFLLGLGFHLQLFQLDTLVTKRWFYFPMIGLLGILGLCIKQIPLRNQGIKISILIASIILIIVLAHQTYEMNPYWQSRLIYNQHRQLF